MEGKITDNKFISGSFIPTLMDDNPFMTPNTLLINILGAWGVHGFEVMDIELNLAIELGEIQEPVIIKWTVDILGF